MEITLNLLPSHLLQRREVQKRKQTRVALAAAAVLPFLLAFGALNARVHMLQGQAQSLRRQVGVLTPIAEKARKLDADTAALKQREDALSRLTVRLPRWSSVLVRLSGLVPPDIAFTSLSIADGQVTIIGQAVNEGAVSTLTTRLAAARFLTATSLKYVRESGTPARPSFAFEIDATLRPEGTP